MALRSFCIISKGLYIVLYLEFENEGVDFDEGANILNKVINDWVELFPIYFKSPLLIGSGNCNVQYSGRRSVMELELLAINFYQVKMII